ncbi:hypothetical protein [Streptomyces sp. NPDC056190]|uniref:hypothetical protein n=1 Tax=Streptomyces sp. NPDC056190 TaxID=3345741 RepID=UPI0035DF1008
MRFRRRPALTRSRAGGLWTGSGRSRGRSSGTSGSLDGRFLASPRPADNAIAGASPGPRPTPGGRSCGEPQTPGAGAQPHYAEALRAADNALALLAVQPVRAYGTEAQIHISQAAAHLATGEAEGALEALAPVLSLPADHRLAPVTRRLNELSAGMSRPYATGTAAIGLRAAIEEFCVDSAPRRLALSPGEGSA